MSGSELCESFRILGKINGIPKIIKALLVDVQRVTLYLVAEARLEHATSRL